VIVSDLRFDCGDCTAEDAARFVGELAEKTHLPPGKAYWLRLAVEEITTNIGEHGYQGHGEVWLTAGAEDDKIWVRIEDEAPPFDAREHDAGPLLATPPAEREEGGFGLLLALHKLDGFSYERVSGRNRNTLIMCRATADAGARGKDGAPNGRVKCADSR
jgi:anti-sigma regulatory factor (Ser/Thr protein kinase)